MMTPLFPPVTVNGTSIDQARIAAEAQMHPAPAGKPGLAWNAAARALVVQELLIEEATRREIDADPLPLGPGQVESHDEARIRALLDHAIMIVPPNDSEIRAEWARDPARFRAPPLWEVSHILVAGDGADAKARAVDIARRVWGNPSLFARIARTESDCPSGKSEGALGQIGPGDSLPEFEAALRTLSSGETTRNPIRSREGWHIIRLDAVAEGAPLPYETVRPLIAEAIEKRAWSKATRDFVATLVDAAEISGIRIAET